MFIFICLISFTLSAQTYTDIPWRKGQIIKDGKIENGIIRLGGGNGAPWLNCNKVYFVHDKNVRPGKKQKRKSIKKYEPGDIDGYNTFTIQDEEIDTIYMAFRTFKVKVASGLMGKKKLKKSFIQLLDSGSVNVFLHIPTPPKKVVTSGGQAQDDYDNAINQSTTYLQYKNDDKVVSAVEFELINNFKECPTIVENIKNETYGVKPLNKRKKKKRLGRFIGNAFGDNEKEAKIIKIVEDYNMCMNNK